MNLLCFTAARVYARLYILIRSLTGYRIPGLGFLLRRCKHPRFIPFLDQQLFFEPHVASCYGLHIVNRVHEPETHRFLNEVFDALESRESFFIDVGANVGAFLLDLARRSNVHVVGFEPSAACVSAITRTMERNHLENFSLFRNLVGDQNKWVSFHEGKSPQGSSIYTSKNVHPRVEQIRLDDVQLLKTIPDLTPTVLMIDVEGYEPNVLRGGLEFITRLKPLIIFEYNCVSKKYFTVQEIQNIFGNLYQIFWLNKDGMLDNELENAWNCAAVPVGTDFLSLIRASICVA